MAINFIDENYIDKVTNSLGLNDPFSKSNGSEVEIKFIDETSGNIKFITSFDNQSSDDMFENEDPLSDYRSPSNETFLIPEFPHLIADDENAIVAPGEGKLPVSILKDKFCEEPAHPHLFPTGKFGYKVVREIKLSPVKYFNQRLLNYTQRFAADSDYIFFANFVTQQVNLRNRI